MLPNFLVIGAQKAGTTSLFEYIRTHPDIYLPPDKETAFFYHDYYYEKGLSFYEERFFKGWEGQKAVGDISPHYLYHPFCRDRIRKCMKNLKFIIILRNPVDRAYSNYWMEVKRGNETLSFKDAIEKESERIKIGLFEKDTFSYVHRGLYYDQIKEYMDWFPESEFLILLTDDLKNDRAKTLKIIYRFLVVNTEVNLPNIQKEFHTASKIRWIWLHELLKTQHWSRSLIKDLMPFKLRQNLRSFLYQCNIKSFTPPPMDDVVRQHLRELFSESNEKLVKLMGKDLSHWK